MEENDDGAAAATVPLKRRRVDSDAADAASTGRQRRVALGAADPFFTHDIGGEHYKLRYEQALQLKRPYTGPYSMLNPKGVLFPDVHTVCRVC